MRIIRTIGGLILAGWVSFASVAAPPAAQAADAPTIASTSLCGDGYLQAFTPGHITALSWQSRSPLSRANNTQKDLPQIWDEAEIIAANKADFILFGTGEGAIADRLGKTSLSLKWGESFETTIENAALLTAALGQNNTALAVWQERLDKLRVRGKARSPKPKVLYLSRAGGSAGAGTFVDAAIAAAGGENIVTTSGWITPDPEIIISLKPDLIITSFFTDGYESVQANGARHKIIREFIAAHPRVDIDGALWPCAGPGLLEAAELIANAMDELP